MYSNFQISISFKHELCHNTVIVLSPTKSFWNHSLWNSTLSRIHLSVLPSVRLLASDILPLVSKAVLSLFSLPLLFIHCALLEKSHQYSCWVSRTIFFFFFSFFHLNIVWPSRFPISLSSSTLLNLKDYIFLYYLYFTPKIYPQKTSSLTSNLPHDFKCCNHPDS